MTERSEQYMERDRATEPTIERVLEILRRDAATRKRSLSVKMGEKIALGEWGYEPNVISRRARVMKDGTVYLETKLVEANLPESMPVGTERSYNVSAGELEHDTENFYWELREAFLARG